MTSIDILLNEHRTLERMAAHLEAAAAQLEVGKEVEPAVLAMMLGFFRSFGDAGHHAKEEQLLFPLLEKHGLTRDLAPISACLAQHASSRAFQREMQLALARMKEGDRDAGRSFAASARDYLALLRDHIRIEDRYFYRLVSSVLPPDEDRALALRMAAMDRNHAQKEWAARQAELLQHCADVVATWRDSALRS